MSTKKIISLLTLGILLIPAPSVETKTAPQIDCPAGEPRLQAAVQELERTIPDNDVELLAHLIMGEAGSDWCEDEMLYGVGSVALNRVASEKFPDTLEGVIFQRGQYQCTWDGNYYKQPTDRCYKIAKELLEGNQTLPEGVVFQSEFTQGSGIYKQVQNMYFCWE